MVEDSEKSKSREEKARAILEEAQKAWLQMKIQALCSISQDKNIVLALQKIQDRLAHATEDLPDSELQKIVSFVFENMGEIENLVK